MKRIIFDIDNTLIIFKNNYWNTIDMTFEYFNIKYGKEHIIKFKNAINDYEKFFNIYDKNHMRELLEKYIGMGLPLNFIDVWTSYLEDAAPRKIKDVEETLNYLSTKYELYALTNWFTEQQIKRLEKANIYKYFKEVIGADKVLIKPNKESFLKAADLTNIEDCIMVGDSLKSDIEGALNIGMKAILIDKKNTHETNKRFKVIKKITELKEIL